MVKMLGRHHLNQVVKRTSPVMQQIESVCFQLDSMRRAQHRFWRFLPKVQSLTLIMRKCQTVHSERHSAK